MQTFIRIQRGALINWFARQGEAIQIEAFRLKRNLFHKFAAEGRAGNATKSAMLKEHPTEVDFGLLVNSVNKMHWTEQALKNKKKHDISTLGAIQDLRIDRLVARKKAKKAPVLNHFKVNFFQLVAQLRQKGLSWRQAAQYLHDYHGQTYNHAWLATAFKRIENERTLASLEQPATSLSADAAAPTEPEH